MESLEAELRRARALDVEDLADAVESIGFECTRCGACCTGETEEPHTATVFPDEVRALQTAAAESDPDRDRYDWRDVARPMPFGLEAGPEGPRGETLEWALQTDDCGDCVFYEEDEARADAERGEGVGPGTCTVHPDRPLLCRTYPFSLALGGTTQPMGEAVDRAGMVRAHECEGLGRDISRADARELAATLKERAVRELEEAIAVRDRYEPVDREDEPVVVHDSEGAKRPDGSSIE